MKLGPGAFIAVTGASGVGKDAVLAAARAVAGDDAHFPTRVITRRPGGGEESTPVDEAEFRRAREAGAFAVWWQAHGLSYAIPVSADAAVLEGRVVVANVSRGALDALEERYARLVVVGVTVSDAVRAQRLRARGREDGEAVDRRLSRPDPAPGRVPDQMIRNDGTIGEGGAQLLRVISSVQRGSTARARLRPTVPGGRP
ncbi:phosphonate metabolism protein/1,5-bisphosphokinase (PRPP-forming) PhnN [Kineococcus sp. NBC_00420]|uniref:phosphonate metabolism protein/1,5-bisphosphokinase (PRPP-forming) PhnN n=1 Tax=unclassified Kineococcus TaxID=2621656 RepID=UPI002E1FB990